MGNGEQPTDDHAVLRAAPDHIIAMLVGMLAGRPDLPYYVPGTEAHAAAERALARQFADRIWAEAAHAGASWGLARNNRITVEVTAQQRDELLESLRPADGK